MSTNRRLKTFRTWQWAAILALAAGLLYLLIGDNRLEARAIRLVPTRGWLGEIAENPDYYWLADGDLLYFDYPDKDHVRPCRVKLLPPGVQASVRPGRPMRFTPDTTLGDISPDGQWITCDRRGDANCIRAVEGGEISQDLPVWTVRIAFWSRDSRGRFSVEWTTEPRRAVMHADGTWIYPHARRRGPFPLPTAIANPSWNDSALGLESSGRLLLLRDSNLGRMNRPLWNGYMFAEVDVGEPTVITRTWSIPRQRDVIAAHVLLSDSGNRLLWVVESSYEHPLERFIRRFLPNLKHGPGYRVTWSVSSIDGSNMREVTYYDIPDPAELDNPKQWPRLTPDDHFISFYRGSWLWVVPVE